MISIDYIEFKVRDIACSKAFYGAAFDWQFQDYGENYCEFSSGNIKGGFVREAPKAVEGALVILYTSELRELEQKLISLGTEIVQPIFAFPGGHRFHFKDPDGYELAVWSDRFKEDIT